MQVGQREVRILREALAKIANTSRDPESKRYAIESLRQYGVAVREYCTHTERVRYQKVNIIACLDCGLREKLEDG